MTTYGAHIVGGEIYYDCLGNNQYRFTIKVYRDCNSSGAQFDSPLVLGAFRNSDNSLYNTYSASYPGSTQLPVVFNNPCVDPPNNICVQEAIYQKVITLPPSLQGYTVVYERCCRGPSIVNLTNPDSQGLTLSATVPGTNSGVTCNSSPRFSNYPPLLLCNNEELVFDHSATDPDGDVIEYELCTPFDGGSQLDPAPDPPNNPPFTNINWDAGFSSTQPFSNTGPIDLNPNTGLLTASPSLLGKFVVGVCAKEYRNGNLISVTRRDFQFVVFNCNITMAADVVAQEDLTTFNSYCDGLTIDFENDSYGGTNYQWNFGDPNNPGAGSTSFEPSYTYPGEGVYDVMLVVNPGWSCTDTSIQTFQVYESLDAHFVRPGPQCITGNSFDFEGDGSYDNAATFMWDFGPNASIPSATTEDVSGVVFDTSGYIPITFEVNWNICDGSYTDSVFIYREPEINFGIDPGLYCAPFTASFIDSSLSDAPISYSWDFGDGNTSSVSDPIHIYDTPGIYDVTLEIEVTEGCPANLTMSKPDLIQVFPSPVADFSVDPAITDVFNTEITLTDLSIDSEEHFYQLNDFADTTARDLTYHFIEGGYHYPYQVVTNEFGCKDTATREIFVEPRTTMYVPNAFTPNADGTNEVFKPVIYDVSEYQFIIFNRWGQIIYETNETQNGWDGRIDGKLAPDGVYLWMVKYRNHLTIWEEHRGHFSLIK